jgi:FKBP-type peptidyl-prolyl cis-trans isomerase FklB
MKRTVLIVLLAGLPVLAAIAQTPPELKDRKERLSYALGAYVGEYWKRQGLDSNDVNWAVMTNAFHTTFFEGPGLLNEQEIRTVLQKLGADLLARQQQYRRELGEKNKKEGDAFLAQNRLRSGVQVSKSGLQTRVLREGAGTSPTTNDWVVVNYRGTFVDGTEFVNSAKFNRGTAPMPLAGTPGWIEALQAMKPGAKWEVVMPPALGHGERGSSPLIGPNATLVYEIELVSVQPRPTNSVSSAASRPANSNPKVPTPR